MVPARSSIRRLSRLTRLWKVSNKLVLLLSVDRIPRRDKALLELFKIRMGSFDFDSLGHTNNKDLALKLSYFLFTARQSVASSSNRRALFSQFPNYSTFLFVFLLWSALSFFHKHCERILKHKITGDKCQLMSWRRHLQGQEWRQMLALNLPITRNFSARWYGAKN